MNIVDIRLINAKRTAVTNKIYSCRDEAGIIRYWIGAKEGTLREVTAAEANYYQGVPTNILSSIVETSDGTPSGDAGGDLDGTYPDPIVGGLQGTPIDPTAPLANDILTFDGTNWIPQAPVADFITAVDNTGNDVNLVVTAGVLEANLASTNISQFTNDSNYIASGDAASGDLGGTYPGPDVVAIQGVAVNSAAPVLDDVLKYDGSEWVPTPFEPTNYSLLSYAALGSTIKAQPVDLSYWRCNQSITLTDKQAKFMAVYLPVAATITGVMWSQIVQGAYTANNNNEINLYSYSGGTLTYVAGTGNDGNLWKAAFGIASKAFTSTYAAAAGVYFIGILYCRSAVVTAPVIAGVSSTATAGLDFTNSAKLCAILAAQTSLSSTTQLMSALSGNVSGLFLCLY